MKKWAFGLMFMIAALAIQLLAGAPATADYDITYSLDNVSFNTYGSGTVTGSLTIDVPTTGISSCILRADRPTLFR